MLIVTFSSNNNYTPCLSKTTVKIVFYHELVKFPLTLIIFATKMAKRMKLCKKAVTFYLN